MEEKTIIKVGETAAKVQEEQEEQKEKIETLGQLHEWLRGDIAVIHEQLNDINERLEALEIGEEAEEENIPDIHEPDATPEVKEEITEIEGGDVPKEKSKPKKKHASGLF